MNGGPAEAKKANLSELKSGKSDCMRKLASLSFASKWDIFARVCFRLDSGKVAQLCFGSSAEIAQLTFLTKCVFSQKSLDGVIIHHHTKFEGCVMIVRLQASS
jgi:hypothetical protein